MKIETQFGLKQKMVELKARVSDLEILRRKLSETGAKYIGTFQQTDQYFEVPEGRLKLREVKENKITELIYYERENIAGPKLDEAFILKFQESKDLKNILKKILNPLSVIEKIREIYQYQGTRIHLDNVKTLGTFIEFERKTIEDPIIVEKNRKILEKLMEKLNISRSNLETLSYNDLVEL
ncbi:class IV adenylate cyclase [Candidatus Bathyarchaeota archaeon]|nr:class IV adenylate cyclase [Candidatus Bathyarchaeota archaeon]